MEDKIKILFKQLNLSDSLQEKLNELKLEKVKVNEKDGSWTFVLNSPDILDIEDYKVLEEQAVTAFNKVKKVYFEIVPKHADKNKLEEYYNYALKKLHNIISFSDIYSNRLDINSLTIEAVNTEEEKQLNDLLPKLKYLLNLYGFSIDLSVYLNTNSNTVSSAIEKELSDARNTKIEIPQEIVTNNSYNKYPKRRPKIEDDKENPKVAVGRLIEDEPRQIKNIIGEMENVTVEGYVFAMDFFESSKNDFRIITLKITDYTDSIYCKVFCKGDEQYEERKKALKEKKWYIIRGNVKKDQYSNNEEVLNVTDINYLDREEEKYVDDAPVKRIELHAHTMMSQMDGVTKLDLGKHTCELVSNCIDAGYRGVAITDHSGCQAFPISFGIIKSYNKGIRKKIKEKISELEEAITNSNDEEEKKKLEEELKQKQEESKNPPIFKGLYGTELTLVDDTVNIVVRPTDDDLIDSTYVVFDTETTGFNAGGADSMIEIGAVKLKNGEIIDRFDSLIDPGRHIPDKITELTMITDEMVKGQENEETVTKKFMEWTGNLPMVAHNAKFDISFIASAMKKYGLGEFKNTVVDTLELSRTLDQGYARHGLSQLVKRYDVPWDEDAHHRADYDAEGTALVFAKMLKKLEMQQFKKISDLDKLISKDEIHKFGRTFHFNAIALNQKGLKNLFTIISLANTVYLYKTPRILRSKLDELREGLIIGSGCYESEVFNEARSKDGEELTNIINFYDYVEVQPVDVYGHLIQTNDFKNEEEIREHLKKIKKNMF